MKITDIKTAEVRVTVDGKPRYTYHYVRIHTDEGSTARERPATSTAVGAAPRVPWLAS